MSWLRPIENSISSLVPDQTYDTWSSAELLDNFSSASSISFPSTLFFHLGNEARLGMDTGFSENAAVFLFRETDLLQILDELGFFAGRLVATRKSTRCGYCGLFSFHGLHVHWEFCLSRLFDQILDVDRCGGHVH